MTELAIPLHRSVEPSSETYRGQAIARLGEWAESAQAAHQVALSLCKTSFVPDAFRDQPEETTAAILAGAEVGLTPMAALRSFDIIQGVAAPRAITLRAIVQSMGHQILVDESTATRCIIRARRRGDTEWQKIVWTMDRAKQLGLANKPNYRTQPQTMLLARATAEAARLIAADAILGIAYSAEEISDGEIATPATEPAPSSKGRRMSLPKPVPVEPEPAETPTETPAEADLPASNPPAKGSPTGGITTAQRSKMLALFNGLDIKDRADRLRLSAAIVGREVDSANKLNQREASALIDTLEHARRAEDPRQYLEELVAAVAVQETFDAEIVEDEG